MGRTLQDRLDLDGPGAGPESHPDDDARQARDEHHDAVHDGGGQPLLAISSELDGRYMVVGEPPRWNGQLGTGPPGSVG